MMEHTWIDEPDADSLLAALQATFGPRAMLFPTPAMTGKMLWRMTRDIADFPPMPAETQRRYRATTGQGRIEMCPVVETAHRLYLYDLRFAYAACCTHLPTGQPVECGSLPLSDSATLPPGRYHVRYQIPENWAHLGLLMTKRERGPGWTYPSEPGSVHETWAARTEIRQAHTHGWAVKIIAGYQFPNPDGKPRPLDAWRDKLMRIWNASPTLAPYVRDILIQTIGSFHAGDTKWTQAIAERATDVPSDARNVVRNADRSFSYEVPEQAGKWQTAYAHPEWTAEIWARCRVRLMSHTYNKAHGYPPMGALTVPRENVVAIRTDAIYTTAPMRVGPREPGYYRLKKVIDGPLTVPTTARELLRIVKEGEDE